LIFPDDSTTSDRQLTSNIFTDSPNKSTVTLNVADLGKYDFGENMTLLS